MNNFEELKTGIKSKVLQALDFSKDISDEEMLELIDRELFGSTRGLAISMESRKNLRLQIFHSIRKLDVLQELVDDPEVTEIMINGVDNIFTERNGRIIKQKLGFESKEKLEDIVQQIVGGKEYSDGTDGKSSYQEVSRQTGADRPIHEINNQTAADSNLYPQYIERNDKL